MIFEYLPTNIKQDIERLCFVCNVLPITKILIPSNPIAKPYPDSLSIISALRNAIWQEKSLRHIQFIPTLKASIHTIESLQSAFLALQYLNIPHVAIISGDTLNQHALTTYHALEILKNMQKKSDFLQKINIFCALESTISARNSYGLCKKLQYGVHNFITQPFYISNICNNKNTQKTHHNIPYFLPTKKIQSFSEFIHFYSNVVKIYSQNNITLLALKHKVKIYCGFLPFFHIQQAHAIHAKKLGIIIPNSYMNDIKNNSLQTNIALFNNLKHFEISMSYLQFKDMQLFLNALK